MRFKGGQRRLLYSCLASAETSEANTTEYSDFCEECKRSVDLNDTDPEVQTIRNPTATYPYPRRMAGGPGSVLFLDAKPHHSRRDSMPNLGGLLAGATAGCTFCAYLRQKTLDHYSPLDSGRIPSGELQLIFNYAWIQNPDRKIRTPLLAELVVKFSPSHDNFELQFNVHDTVGSTIPNLAIFRRPIDPSRLSEHNVQRIRQWANDDSVCAQGWNATNYVPKRLLDLGASAFAQASNAIDPVLIQTRTHPSSESPIGEGIKYVALSYCWGTAAPSLITETHSLKERLRRIPIDTMPPCFQDAIEVVRVLGLRYLWIDALCIVQDDSQDWQIESGSMCDIFSNAFITIGVASTASCYESFLRKPLPRSFHIPFHSMINPTISGSYSLHESLSNYSTRGYNLNCTDSLGLDLFDSAWNNRGWVWQEQNVPRKLLVWGKSMFHLRDIGTESEDGMIGKSKRYRGELSRITTKDEMENWWYGSLVRKFSERRLTKRTDRLPAVSGLAKRSSSVIGTPYLAGHWFDKENFAMRLLWISDYYSTFEGLFQDLTSGYSGPSWSWASRTQRTWWPTYTEYNYISEIVDCRTSLIGLDPTGAVSEGILILNGKLKKVPFRPSSGKRSSSTYFDGRETKGWNIDINRLNLKCNLDWIPDVENGNDPENPEWQLQMLPLRCCKRGSIVRDIDGLLLFPQGERFLRVGTFRLWDMHNVGTIDDVFGDLSFQTVIII